MDSHAVVIARRSLLVFLYKQLGRLFEARDSIFEYCEGGEGVEKVARIRDFYALHLYMKQPPCGDASRKLKSKMNKKCSFHE